ncbi:MAG: histidine kinase [Chitinophagales bacterium]|nr:histidine kinase [Chitinophagales bacterium]
MNGYQRYIILLCMLLFAVRLIGQPVSKKYGRQTDPISQARSIKSEKPEKAIRLLNQALQQGLKKGDYTTVADAYILLGEIYEDIGQKDLALQRYQQAGQFLDTFKQPSLQAENYTRIGNLQVELGLYAEAERNFQYCLNMEGINNSTWVKCKEGLADAKRKQGAFEQSEAIYDTIDEVLTQQRDSIGMARVSAKRSQNYLSNQDFNNAQGYYSNSIQLLPEKVQNYEDYQPIEEANRALIDALEGEDAKYNLSQNTLLEQEKRFVPPVAQLNEQMQLAELSLNSGRVEEAEEVLSALKNNLTFDIEPIKKANVHKLSSSVKLEKGDYKGAIEEYQQYISENDEALARQEAELAQQANILREQGAVDLAIKDYLLQQTEQNLLHNQIKAQRLYIALLALLLLAVGIAYILVRRKEHKRRRANNMLEIKSLRAQMNPHFIFNALNSINNFISRQDERSANKYLSDFARLMRLVLEHNQKEFISLEEELRLLELYLKLEHARFEEKFDYKIHKDAGLHLAEIEIPPMLIQPFVENAVWHGLRYKTSKGALSLHIQKEKEEELIIKIADNGIGRTRSIAAKTDQQSRYKSTGVNNVNHRIELINELYDKQYQLEITNNNDQEEDVGTLVTLIIPLTAKEA